MRNEFSITNIENKNNSFEDTLLTVKDIQAIFHGGRRQAYNYMKIHGFPAMKLGGRFVVSVKALDRWIQANLGKTVIK